MSTNYHDVTSPSHFQKLLSEDLNRVSVLNFWAEWAEPCKQMNVVAAELAKKYSSVLFLQIEAESQDDISESFDIQAVPTFIILRGHTLLQRISGADAPALTSAVAKFAATPAANPQSHTNQTPSKASLANVLNEPEESEEELNERMQKIMNQSKVVLFMKGNPNSPRCGFSRKIAGLLKDRNIEFAHFDILEDEKVRQGLKVLNNWPTFPQLIIKGEFVGGLDIVQEMAENGELDEVLA
ncbi:putative glutaredoxin [Moniliophthora roreri MCA 2997]|uniref:Glutaredoxin n=2 Tax=Moniliophthora roreri TaxID=221103 RepID=V2X490_MONRO|nr:putative glutaredoxin [Moniliophthora roreri MCA 2997]KAI3619537.1 putative glutaredoxin [Moniliophthora roreri]